MQARRDAYESLIYRAHNEENRLAEEREGVAPGTPAEEGAVADQLWQRFQAEHPDLAADEAMVARAATRVAKRQGIADHAAFIRAVAREVEAANVGRGRIETGGGARAPEAEPEPRSMFDELTARQRAEGLI